MNEILNYQFEKGLRYSSENEMIILETGQKFHNVFVVQFSMEFDFLKMELILNNYKKNDI